MNQRLPFARACALLLGLSVVACEENGLGGIGPATPQNLTYRLEPSGDPDRPSGIVLTWNTVSTPNLESYNVYSRGGTAGSFGLRGITTSNTFHDNGVPHAQYYVRAVDTDGDQSGSSNVVTIDEFLRLEAPATIQSISLNRAIHLEWSDNPFLSDPDRFAWYYVYSTGYDLDLGACDAQWAREGTTVAPEFLAGALQNGSPRCFGVSAVSTEGYESLWSPLWQDTPRPDGRNVLLYPVEGDITEAGFRFWDDVNTDGQGQPAELGLVLRGDDASADFRVYRDAFDTLWIEPVYAGTSVQVYGQVSDLTGIDFAPATGYGSAAVQAIPTYGYVFEIDEGGPPRYGALRVTHMSRDYVIFDWSFQTDLGNPELVVRGGMATVTGTGAGVRVGR